MAYEPIVPPGLHLGTSHVVPGAVTGHLFDADNALQGHAAWQWVSEDAAGGLTAVRWAALGLFVGIAITVVAFKAAPGVRKWWDRVHRGVEIPAALDDVDLPEGASTPVRFSPGTVGTRDEAGANMSAAETQQHPIAA